MANFPRVKPAGWGLNAKLTSAEANQLDIDHSKSVNGDDGGTYAGALTWGGFHDFVGDVYLRREIKLVSLLGDADADITIAANVWAVPVALTGARNYTVRHTAPGGNLPILGSTVRFVRWAASTGQRITLIREDASKIIEFSSAAPGFGFAELMFTGVLWEPIGWAGTDVDGLNFCADLTPP